MNIAKAIIVGMVGIGFLTFTTLLIAGPFYDLMSIFDTTVAEVGESNLSTNWSLLANYLKLGFWTLAILGVVSIVLWVYLRAQRREYVTGGYYH